MIVDIIGTGQIGDSLRPNLPTDYHYESWEDLGDGTCKVHGLQIPEYVGILEGEKVIKRIPQWITNFQGRAQLIRMGKLQDVLGVIEYLKINDPEKGYMYEAVFNTIAEWQRISQTIIEMAGSIGIVGEDLDNFFINAKQIELA
jgi:hypothetical protein